jgi:ubiquitin-protein ligase
VSPRLRRLTADADQLRHDFAGHPHIRVTAIGPEPSEQYRIEYQLRGVTLAPGSSQPSFGELFAVVLTLPATYPRSKPLVVTESLVFHPNFGSRAGDEVCIADYWSPAQTLSDIVVQIGEMLQYQESAR